MSMSPNPFAGVQNRKTTQPIRRPGRAHPPCIGQCAGLCRRLHRPGSVGTCTNPALQRCRFGDKISLELELENERLLEVRMPKLILQPLVENAVSHGLEGKLGHGTVRIIVENSDRTFFLRVRDDGVGMPDEQVERLNAQFGGVGGADMTQPCGGIALRNVNSRIRLMFGEDYGLHLFSAAGVGTECCVTLPLRFREA